VPASEPLLFHNSRPLTPLSARKNSVPLTLVRFEGSESGLGGKPGRMSLTRLVPTSEPLLFHSSLPFVPLFALKKSVPLTFVRKWGEDAKKPEPMSLTRTVPALVPLLFHNSRPFVPLSAVKKSVPLTLIGAPGDEPVLPGLMSLTSTVPAAVPSL